VIITPNDNDFFSRHEKECTYIGRSYYANGVSGFISLKTAPISNTEVSKINNGNTVLIQFTYHYNGELWGVVIGDKECSGWIPMSQLVIVYDYISFDEDHKNDFYEYKGGYESLKNAKGKVVLWSWPGSGKVKGTVDVSEIPEYDPRFSHAYKDKQGREWLYTDYWCGYRNFWICLNDPTNAKIPAFNPAPQPKIIKSKGNDFIGKSKNITEQLDRRFYINSPSGYAAPKEEPGSEKEILTYEDKGIKFSTSPPEVVLMYHNDDIVHIARTYLQNGKYWGATSSGLDYFPSGWIPMDELLMLYERQDFEEENKNHLYIYTGNYDAVFAAERHILWQWPGSDREKRIIDREDYVLKNIDVLYAYKDSQSREWGYVNLNYAYMYEGEQGYTFRREGWICLTDPSNSSIPAFNPAPAPIIWSPDGSYQWTHTDPAGDFAGQYSLYNIIKVKTYEQNKTFADVLETDWHKDAIAAAYEYGIVDGMGGNKFNPAGTLTGAEALIIASRIHACYKYGKVVGNRLVNEYNVSNGYLGDEAVIYCKAEGIISGKEFEDYKYLQYPVTRAQMVNAWSKILQPKDVLKQNTVINLPDVTADTPYYEDIILFYEAGIISGTDAKGTFHPNSNLTRAEAAAIFMNLIDVNKRQNGRTYGK
jgi:hypothetical protein